MGSTKRAPRLLVCVKKRLNPDSVSCASRGSESLANALEASMDQRGLPCALERIHCFGQCEKGPNMRIAPGGAFFRGVGPEDLDRVVEAVAEAFAALRESADSSNDSDP